MRFVARYAWAVPGLVLAATVVGGIAIEASIGTSMADVWIVAFWYPLVVGFVTGAIFAAGRIPAAAVLLVLVALALGIEAAAVWTERAGEGDEAAPFVLTTIGTLLGASAVMVPAWATRR